MQKLAFFCFIFILSTFGSAFAGSVHSYQELATAMNSGDRFVIVLNLQECTGKSNMPIGYFIPSKMILMPASNLSSERIVTSDLHFTDHMGNPLYEYTKYTFQSDDSVVLRTVNYDPVTFKPIGSEHVINCVVDKGISIITYPQP